MVGQWGFSREIGDLKAQVTQLGVGKVSKSKGTMVTAVLGPSPQRLGETQQITRKEFNVMFRITLADVINL